jgi:hypothetical protein
VKWPRVSCTEYLGQLGAAVQRGREHGIRRIATVRPRYQDASSEDNASWKKLSVCSNELQSV